MAFNLTLEEIEFKRQELEQHLAEVMSRELTEWQRKNCLCVQDVNVRLASNHSLGSAKTNIVTGVSVDLDYKP
ncbi:hypothetical protein [Acinetobacter pullicarnis]|uniref:hypothetical protein n=1 Tax=Acinetobacter pullicarnis TaxID=2576829 RepID=UPI001120672D|nr:hypothetical protein [Acinetobacter pullicarnis]